MKKNLKSELVMNCKYCDAKIKRFSKIVKDNKVKYSLFCHVNKDDIVVPCDNAEIEHIKS